MRTTIIALVMFTITVAPAYAKTRPAGPVHEQQVRFHHADGFIKAIGKNARRTIYSPRWKTRHKWCRALRWLMHVRADAQAKIIRLTTPPHPPNDWAEFDCIHRHEGAADSNTGNGYYGGVQMDYRFQEQYGPEFLAQWGTADNWPIWAQVVAARRARDGFGKWHARGYTPWPNTARYCGLL